jgi:hypothetical protein
MAEPMLRCWLQEGQPPQTTYTERPGRWVAEPGWPPPGLKPQTYCLNAGSAGSSLDGVLAETAALATSLALRGFQTTGIDTGSWCPYGLPGDYPADQQAQDGKSLTFTSAPVEAPVDILGFPQVKLTVAADQPIAFVSVRLGDVAPEGTSTLVSWGVLNLTHRGLQGHEFPRPLTPAEPITITVQLKVIGYTLAAGHRWRVAVSPTFWPMVWPSPRPVMLTLFTGEASQLILPIRPFQPEESQLRPFEPAECSPPLPVEKVRPGQTHRYRQTDVITGRTELKNVFDFGRMRFNDNGLEVEDTTTDIYTIVEGDPLSAMVRCERLLEYRRDDWQVRIETASTMTGDATTFRVTNLLDAYEGNTRVFTKTCTFSVPRDLV